MIRIGYAPGAKAGITFTLERSRHGPAFPTAVRCPAGGYFRLSSQSVLTTWNLPGVRMFTSMGPGAIGVANGQTDQERALGAGDHRVGCATCRRCCGCLDPVAPRVKARP